MKELFHKVKLGGYKMKYVNHLTDEELTDIFKLFLVSDGEFVSLEIGRFDDSIELTGIVKEPDNENTDEMLELEDDYSLTDYSIAAYHHSGGQSCQRKFRKWMYKKFKSKYAKDFLLN